MFFLSAAFAPPVPPHPDRSRRILCLCCGCLRHGITGSRQAPMSSEVPPTGGTHASSPPQPSGGLGNNRIEVRLPARTVENCLRWEPPHTGVPSKRGVRLLGWIHAGEQRFSVAKKRSHNNVWALAPEPSRSETHG